MVFVKYAFIDLKDSKRRLEFGGSLLVSSLVSATALVAKAYLRTGVYFWCKQQIFRDCPYVCVGGGRVGEQSVWQCLLSALCSAPISKSFQVTFVLPAVS